MDQGQSSQATGTRDETYDIIAVVYHALQGAENCQTYMQDASSRPELRQFFERAIGMQRQLADEGKRLLHDQLMQGEQGGDQSGSAFSQFGSGGSDQFSSSTSGGMGAPGSMGSQGMSGSQDMSSQGTGSTAGLGRDVGNDPQSEQFGQSASGQGQRHSEMTTGGGGTSSF